MTLFVYAHLVKHARSVIAHSGGITTEEPVVLGVLYLKLGDNTQRPVTVIVGTSELIGTDPINLGSAHTRCAYL